MSLKRRLINQIKESGPLTVYDYFTQAMYDPVEGYYAQKVPIGRGGDYITAPEMTQVFGEVIALWMVDLWQQAGSPVPFHLVEMGPGRGTLMADILRTFTSLKIPFSDLAVHLVEISQPLQELQKTALSPFPVSVHWHKEFGDIPDNQGFCLMLANEFWDALPIEQFISSHSPWIKKRVGIKGEELIFLPQTDHSISEMIAPETFHLAVKMSDYLGKNRGVALFLDYGYEQGQEDGESLQAVYNHRSCPVLDNPGQADLSHYVNFGDLQGFFNQARGTVYGPKAQGDFLNDIGLAERTEYLCQQAKPEQQGSLRTAAVRLTHPRYMGNLFKVMAVVSSGHLRPAGFCCPYLEASSLKNIPVRHGFFTRQGGVSKGDFASLNVVYKKKDDSANVVENRRRIANSLGFSPHNLVTINQVHSTKVLMVDKPFWNEVPDGDALVTTTPGLLIGVYTADCVPVLLSTHDGRIVAAIHAGWRGAVNGILEATLKVMKHKGADDIIAALGPCIWQESYEISQEFYNNETIDRRFFNPGSRPNHWQFDLPGYVMSRLADSGIKIIQASPADTFTDATRFFSCRRKTLLNEADFGCSLSAIGIPDFHE
jgi:YfiH family protein